MEQKHVHSNSSWMRAAQSKAKAARAAAPRSGEAVCRGAAPFELLDEVDEADEAELATDE